MNPLDSLLFLLNTTFKSENGDHYPIELLDGMSTTEIKQYQSLFPHNYLPKDIIELLSFTRGLKIQPLKEIRFDNYNSFLYKDLFPHAILLVRDTLGDCLILDIDLKGNWNEIYYVGQQPHIVIKYSHNLTDFIESIIELSLKDRSSILNDSHKNSVITICEEKINIQKHNQKEYNFSCKIMEKFPAIFTVADLTYQPIHTGFIWKSSSDENSKIIRIEDKPIWIVEKKTTDSLLTRLLTKKSH